MRYSELYVDERHKLKEFISTKNITVEEFKQNFQLFSFEEMQDNLKPYFEGEYKNAEENMGFNDAVNHIIEEQELPYVQLSDEVWIKETRTPIRWIVLHSQHGGIIKEIIAYCDSKKDAEKKIYDLELEGVADMENYEIATEGGI